MSGLDLTPEDWELMEAAAAELYLTEEAPVGTVETWSNDQSGNRGSIELIRTGQYQGMPCRRLQHDIRVKDVADPYRFPRDRCQTAEENGRATCRTRECPNASIPVCAVYATHQPHT